MARGARTKVAIGAVVVMAISPAVAAKRATIECPRAGACLGTSGPDRILGTPGRDDVRGRDGNDVMDGKSGADVMRGGGGLDSVRGGDGDDTLYAGPVADTRRQEFEWLRGGRGRDVLYGGVLDHLSGDEGADVLYGSRGLQWLLGGDGDDVLHGEGGHDYYFFQGSWGHDVVFDSPPREPGRLENYIGFTEVYVDLTIDLRSDAAAPEVSTADASLTIDWANDAITMVQSGDGDDTIHGNALENLISTAGDDVVYGHEGDDVVQQGSWSNVTVDMGEGDDEVTMWDEAPGTPDVIDCGEGDADEVTYDPEDTVVNCEILHEVPFNRQ